MMTCGSTLLADIPRIPSDAVPVELSQCREHDSRQFGVCLVSVTSDGGIWLQFYHQRELVLIRYRESSEAPRVDVWVRDDWNTF